MRRRSFLAACMGSSWFASAAETRPNIVFILADDLGYGDLGCYGQKEILTPNIDRMAADGIRFTRAYAGNTVCAPSRCALMTGLHSGHGRVRGNRSPQTPLAAGDLTVAELLRKAGYRTAGFGKWGLGDAGTTGSPTRKGFEEWFGYLDQVHAHEYYPEFLIENEKEVPLPGNAKGANGTYSHDLFTKRALEFIGRERAQPYFLYLAYTIPHANPALGAKSGNGLQVPTDAPYTSRGWPQVEKNFAAMITRMDGDVGKVLDAIRLFGGSRSTLVLFASDNGPHRAGNHEPSFFKSNGGLRGIKGDMYEGGIRIPMVAQWRGHIHAGQTSHRPTAFWDFLPTAAELAGQPVPAGLDGASIVPTLLGKRQPRSQPLYWENGNGKVVSQALLDEDWKIVRPDSRNHWELYNLKADPGEARNLASSQPNVFKRMESLYTRYRTESPLYPLPRPSGESKDKE